MYLAIYLIGFFLTARVLSGTFVKFYYDLKEKPIYLLISVTWFITVPIQIVLVGFEYVYGYINHNYFEG